MLHQKPEKQTFCCLTELSILGYFYVSPGMTTHSTAQHNSTLMSLVCLVEYMFSSRRWLPYKNAHSETRLTQQARCRFPLRRHIHMQHVGAFCPRTTWQHCHDKCGLCEIMPSNGNLDILMIITVNFSGFQIKMLAHKLKTFMLRTKFGFVNKDIHKTNKHHLQTIPRNQKVNLFQ